MRAVECFLHFDDFQAISCYCRFSISPAFAFEFFEVFFLWFIIDIAGSLVVSLHLSCVALIKFSVWLKL
jgi:hypothetical protein